jgi:hypothetical protein
MLLDLESAPTKFIYTKGGIPGHTLDAHGIVIGCFQNRLGPDVRTRASALYRTIRYVRIKPETIP